MHPQTLVTIRVSYPSSGGAPHSPGAYPAAFSGDLDADADVDATDLSILLGAWGPCGSAPTAMDLVAFFGFDTIEELSAYVEELPDGLREALVLGALEMMSGGGA